MGRKPRDFSIEQIGQLKPLYIDKTKSRGNGCNIYWICQCSCGNTISVNSCNLNSGLQKNRNMSCGKCHANRKDLSGNIYGKLTVLNADPNYIPNEKNGWKTKWLCKCECGNIISVFRDNLVQLHTTSCGCINQSIGEANIEKLLQENHINYAKEFSFSDLKNKRRLRFDFAIFDNNNNLSHLIEFDGRQHNNDYNVWGGEETLAERQLRDQMKNEYCQNKGILLIRIPYEKRDTITLQDLGVNKN